MQASLPASAEANPPPGVQRVHVGRQPIYTRKLDVYAYELLFRTTDGNCEFTSGDMATGEVMVNALMDIGVGRIAGNARTFINMTEAYITGTRPLPPLGDRVVLEVLETVPPSDEVVAGLQRLISEGYRIALDDYTGREDYEPLLNLAHIVKVDVLDCAGEELARQVARLGDYNVKLLAEKVETYEQYRTCQDLGFDYFQGYFFCKPDVVSGTRPAGNRLIAAQLLSALQKPDIEFEELQGLLSRDATLAYRLLAYVNSAYFNLRAPISSIRHALAIVGTRGVRQWAMLVLMMALNNGKPDELLRVGMIRARMCELLAARWPGESPDAFFTGGLFSILDALLDRDIHELSDTLTIDPNIVRDLQHGDGHIRATLGAVLAYEQGRLCDLEESWRADCQRVYLDALAWSRELDRGGNARLNWT